MFDMPLVELLGVDVDLSPLSNAWFFWGPTIHFHQRRRILLMMGYPMSRHWIWSNNIHYVYVGFHNHGVPKIMDGFCQGKPIYKWMMTGGTTSGNMVSQWCVMMCHVVFSPSWGTFTMQDPVQLSWVVMVFPFGLLGSSWRFPKIGVPPKSSTMCICICIYIYVYIHTHIITYYIYVYIRIFHYNLINLSSRGTSIPGTPRIVPYATRHDKMWGQLGSLRPFRTFVVCNFADESNTWDILRPWNLTVKNRSCKLVSLFCIICCVVSPKPPSIKNTYRSVASTYLTPGASATTSAYAYTEAPSESGVPWDMMDSEDSSMMWPGREDNCVYLPGVEQPSVSN